MRSYSMSGLPRDRDSAAVFGEPLLSIRVLKVDIHHHEPEAGGYADQRIWPPCPPFMDGVGAGGRVLEAVRSQRALVGVTGEDANAALGEL